MSKWVWIILFSIFWYAKLNQSISIDAGVIGWSLWANFNLTTYGHFVCNINFHIKCPSDCHASHDLYYERWTFCVNIYFTTKCPRWYGSSNTVERNLFIFRITVKPRAASVGYATLVLISVKNLKFPPKAIFFALCDISRSPIIRFTFLKRKKVECVKIQAWLQYSNGQCFFYAI